MLTGEYTREKHGQHEAGRGAWATSALTDRTYDLLEEMARVAAELETTVPRVAIAWVQARPGVTSAITGTRTLNQLEDNLAALGVQLSAEQTSRLDALWKPTLNSPAHFWRTAPHSFTAAPPSTGETREPWPLSPQGDADRY